jgi:hypothetical protein
LSHPGRPRRLQCAQFEASTSVLVAADNGLAARTPDIDALVAKLRTLPDLVAPETIVNPVEMAAAEISAPGSTPSPTSDPVDAACSTPSMPSAAH